MLGYEEACGYGNPGRTLNYLISRSATPDARMMTSFKAQLENLAAIMRLDVYHLWAVHRRLDGSGSLIGGPDSPSSKQLLKHGVHSQFEPQLGNTRSVRHRTRVPFAVNNMDTTPARLKNHFQSR